MTTIAATWDRPAALSAPRFRLPNLSEIAFAAALAGYLSLGAYLGLVLHAMQGDAYSRVTNASYVLFSRDPHLAAMGFVWPPLPTLVELPLVALKTLWPPMLEQGFAAVIMSALFMAGAVYQLSRTLSEFAVPRVPRFLLVAAFALHPMIVYYGAIGTSEAPMVFFLVLTVRHLARWVRTPDVDALVFAGVGLAGAYLTRYEAAFSAVGVAAVVVLLTLIRSEGPARRRLDVAVADAAIVLAPMTLAFVGWAFASWLIVGAPFAQFSSAYGNASQMAVATAAGVGEMAAPTSIKLALALRRLSAIEIPLAAAIAMAAIAGARRRDDRWAAVLAVLAPAIAFMVVAYVVGLVFPSLRYYIMTIPLGVLLLGLTIAPLWDRGETQRRPAARRWLGAIGRGALVAALCLSALVAIPAAAVAMLDPVIAVEESRDLAGLLGPNAASDDRRGADLNTFATEREVAGYLDGLSLPPGSVLLDAFTGFAIVAQSADPKQFVITPDQDFRAVLADPRAFGVRYVVAPSPSGNGLLDAINVTYPGLAADGAGIAVLDTRFAAHGQGYDWYVYRMTAP